MFASKDTLLTRPSGGYNISRSVRFRKSASGYFNRTAGSAATDGTKFTISCWVKRGILDSGASLLYTLMSAEPAATTYLSFYQDTIYFQINDGGAGRVLQTTQVFRDPSAWYHCVFVWDRGAATASQKMRLYINGTEVTSFSTDQRSSISGSASTGILTQSVSNTIGRRAGASADYFDGYITEFNAIDGQALTPSSFGETDSITGVWKPKAYSGTYGTNGFELNFSDNSNNTAATIGKDYSGNGNNWTPNNISVTAGVTYDSMTDVPTLTSATAANYCVLNPLATSNGTLNDGNLTWSPSGNNSTVWSSFAVNTGKWYFEMTKGTSGDAFISISQTPKFNGFQTDYDTVSVSLYMYYTSGGTGANRFQYNSTPTAFPSGFGDDSNGTVYGVTLDFDAKEITVYRNNDGTTKATFTMPAALYAAPLFVGYSVTSTWGSGQFYWNFGQRPFTYTPPTGYVALNTYNLPASTITNGAAYMAATTYTGTGSSLAVSNAVNGVSFQPDLVWIKARGNTYSHNIEDSVRGVTLRLQSDSTAAEAVGANGQVTAFSSGGFTQNGGVETGGSSATYVGWQWKAGGTSASNTNGSITSTVSVGATQGFSVVTYTGTGANATVGHGLGVAPSMMIIKNRASATNWIVYSNVIGAANFLSLNLTNASAAATTTFNSTAPTSSVFSIGTSTGVNASASTHVAYCFSAVAGYSAFGSYTGNGSTDGPFVYTGFRPRFVIIKCTSDAGQVWLLLDTSRSTYNVASENLIPNESSVESTNPRLDFLSNGIKIRNTYGNQNTNGSTYIYMAFAEVPFRSALAR